MIFEERKASEMICPLAIAWSLGAGRLRAGRCRGAQCAAWSWQSENPIQHISRNHQDWYAIVEPVEKPHFAKSWNWIPYSQAEDEFAHWEEPISEAKARATGFCGMVR